MSSLVKYTYYDSPDGKDLVKKLFYANKYVTLFGFSLASSEIILVSKPVGYLNTVIRYGQLMGPLYATASTFCITTYVTTKIRGKDDETNYAIGGFASGVLMGVLLKQNLLGMWLGVGCAIAGAVKKHSKLNNYEFFPINDRTNKPIYGDFRTPYVNWTLYDARPKGWVAAEERKE